MRSVIFTVVLSVLCIAFVSSHTSFYYSNQNSANYHPPYDFTVPSAATEPTCTSTFCPSGTIATNPNYSIPPSSGTCTNVPAFMSGSAFDFDSCCTIYEQCLYQCGPSKTYCDQQFYGCMWAQCGVSYRLRPGDRFGCRAYATCYASYMSNSTCDSYNNLQSQACTCNNVPASSSSIPTQPNVTRKSVEERQTTEDSSAYDSSVSASFLPSASASYNPSNSYTPESSSYSASYNPSPSASYIPQQASNNGIVSDSSQAVLDNWGYYTVRPVPAWSDWEGRCPPYFGNYVSVMSDQEFNDINYWYVNSGSSLKVWWKLF